MTDAEKLARLCDAINDCIREQYVTGPNLEAFLDMLEVNGGIEYDWCAACKHPTVGEMHTAQKGPLTGEPICPRCWDTP